MKFPFHEKIDCGVIEGLFIMAIAIRGGACEILGAVLPNVHQTESKAAASIGRKKRAAEPMLLECSLRNRICASSGNKECSELEVNSSRTQVEFLIFRLTAKGDVEL